MSPVRAKYGMYDFMGWLEHTAKLSKGRHDEFIRRYGEVVSHKNINGINVYIIDGVYGESTPEMYRQCESIVYPMVQRVMATLMSFGVRTTRIRQPIYFRWIAEGVGPSQQYAGGLAFQNMDPPAAKRNPASFNHQHFTMINVGPDLLASNEKIDRLQQTVVHEVAHLISYTFSNEENVKVQELYKKHKDMFSYGGPHDSYGATNHYEWFAELVARVMTANNLTPQERQVVKEMKLLMSSATTSNMTSLTGLARASKLGSDLGSSKQPSVEVPGSLAAKDPGHEDIKTKYRNKPEERRGRFKDYWQQQKGQFDSMGQEIEALKARLDQTSDPKEQESLSKQIHDLEDRVWQDTPRMVRYRQIEPSAVDGKSPTQKRVKQKCVEAVKTYLKAKKDFEDYEATRPNPKLMYTDTGIKPEYKPWVDKKFQLQNMVYDLRSQYELLYNQLDQADKGEVASLFPPANY